jgi:energy-coupling factor transporter ATP-binding protein EcfA2
MQMVGYQIKCYEKLYDSLVNMDKQLILFTGQKGCGKSTIIEELANALKETWKVYLLMGSGKTSPPYYTWYAAQKSVKQVKNRITDISFGVNFQPVGLPVGIEMSIGLTSAETVFNGNEQAILKDIKRTTIEDDILFLADDYNAWDQASKELLEKILICKTNIFGSEKHIHIILIDSQFDISSDMFSKFTNEYIEVCAMDKIRLEDIVQIVNQQPEIKALQICDLDNIIHFTGYDLRLINLAVQYQQNNVDFFEVHSLKDLLEKRISHISKNHEAVCHALEYVSIIDSLFSEKEAAYLLDKEPLHAERILDKAVDLYLIRKRHAYDFPNLEIQKYFEEKLDIEKKYLHHRFAQYLQLHHPEDYLSRAYHLYLSEEANNDQNIVNAAYLTAIGIVRRKEITGGIPELTVEKQLSKIICKLPTMIKDLVKSNITTYFEGNTVLNKCNYSEAIIQFAGLNIMYAPKAFAVEVMRLHLLSHIQLADDMYEIKRVANEIYDQIIDVEFCEDEIWCRIALLLLEVYGDRHIQLDKFLQLKSGFESRIRKHMNKTVFRSLYAKYACKSALFYNSLIAVKLTDESCEFFRTYSSTLNLYFSLCNNAANRIVCGEYVEAEKRLRECKEIISDNLDISFPSTYKIENNLIINNFLQSEGELLNYSSRNKETIIPAAATAVIKLEQLRDQQGYEVSHVINFNLLSMYMICDMKKQAADLLQKFEEEYKNLDVFYKYYYHNIYCANNILMEAYNDALHHLEILENLHVVLLSSFSKVLNKRNQILHQLIYEKYNGDSYCFNYEFIRRGIHIQDSSASFWGRGFLLSDLQFLSW